MNEFELRNTIKEIAIMHVELTKKRGPTRAAELFEKLISRQDEVLEHYKLPGNPYYQSLLEFKAIPWDNEIDKLIELLEKESQNVKSSSSLSEIEILCEAKATKRDPMFILPAIGITTHVYTIWVYQNILLKSRDTPKNVLIELKRLNFDLLNTVGNMHNNIEWLENPETFIETMEEKGLQYIRSYVKSILNDFS